MNVAVVVLLSGLLPSQLSPDVAELKLLFDRTRLRLGDLAYCEVQLWNRSDKTLKLRPTVPEDRFLFEVEAGGTLLKDRGGNVVGGPAVVTLGRYASTVANVILWNEEILKRWEQAGGRVTVRGVLMDGTAAVRAAPVTIDIKGQVASKELLLKVYASPQERRRVQEDAGSLERFYTTVYSVEMAWLLDTANIPKKVLDQLTHGVRRDSAFYRMATTARLLEQYYSWKTIQFEQLERGLLDVLAECGPAERRWLLRHAAGNIEYRGKTWQESEQFYRDLKAKLEARLAVRRKAPTQKP